jgi:hypothetical protein
MVVVRGLTITIGPTDANTKETTVVVVAVAS